MKCTLLMIPILISVKLYASSGQGNGGDAVVCRDKNEKITSAELLDYWIAREKFGLHIDEDETDESAIIDSILKKIKLHSPAFASNLKLTTDRLLKALDVFRETGEKKIDNILFTSATLEDIPDSKHYSYRNGCKVEQLVIRHDKVNFDEEPEFEIQTEILNALPPVEVAGIILHEAIYVHYRDILKCGINS